ncbi:MAG TPA: hypothetical protein PLO13_05190, partial [Anaerolineaceae bacterium]|nr:hypothetical protein [Anaerolineaceae bacterium]
LDLLHSPENKHFLCQKRQVATQKRLAMTTSLAHQNDCDVQSGNMGAINSSRIQLRNPAYEKTCLPLGGTRVKPGQVGTACGG